MKIPILHTFVNFLDMPENEFSIILVRIPLLNKNPHKVNLSE